MAHWNDPFWVAYAILAPVSAVSSLALMRALWDQLRTQPLMTAVFWMSFSDFLLSIRHFVEFITYHPNLKHGTVACLFSAAVGTFAIVATTSWYFIITLTIIFIFKGFTRDIISQKIYIMHSYVWILSLICALEPLLTKKYGSNPDDGMCWVAPPYRMTRLVILAPVTFYFFFFLYFFILYLLPIKLSFP